MFVLALLPNDWYRLMPVVSALAGAFVSPITATLRAAWPRLVQGPRLRAVYALDATAQEVLFAIGPMLGALVVSFVNPRAGVLSAAALALVSVWWYGVQQQPAMRHDETVRRLTAPQLLWHRHRLPLILAFAFCVTAFASVSLGIVAFADDHGNRLIAGVLETVWAVGSLAGGLIVGALPGRRNSFVWRRSLLVSVGMLACVFATWSPVSLGIALLLSGCVLAPTVGALYERLGAMTPDSVRTEIFGWMGSGAMVGGAVGSARRRPGRRNLRRPLRVADRRDPHPAGDAVPAPHPTPPPVRGGHGRRGRGRLSRLHRRTAPWTPPARS